MRTAILSVIIIFLFFSMVYAANASVTKSVTQVSLDAQSIVAGTVITDPLDAKQKILEVQVSGTEKKPVTVFTLTQPVLSQRVYALKGKISYNAITVPGYLEMMNYIGQFQFFSRTMAAEGPMALIQSSSDWRFFILPFTLSQDAPTPSKIDLNVYLPEGGTIYLKDIALMEYAPGDDPIALLQSEISKDKGYWWSDQTAGLLGAIFGVIIGLVGAIIGVCTGKGYARKMVLFLVYLALSFGCVMLLAGIVAVLFSQPYAVYYPLLLGGVITTGVLGMNVRKIRQRYMDMELKKIEADVHVN